MNNGNVDLGIGIGTTRQVDQGGLGLLDGRRCFGLDCLQPNHLISNL